MLAFHIETAAAFDAVPAATDVVDGHPVPRFEGGDGRAHLRHDAGRFVPGHYVRVSEQAEDRASPPLGGRAIVHVQIATTQAGCP